MFVGILGIFLLFFNLPRYNGFSVLPQNSAVDLKILAPRTLDKDFSDGSNLAVNPLGTVKPRWGSKSVRNFQRRRKRSPSDSRYLVNRVSHFHDHPDDQFSVQRDSEPNINVISSHTVMGVNVASGPNGHEIIIEPQEIGHHIQIDTGSYQLPPGHVHPEREFPKPMNAYEYNSEAILGGGNVQAPYNSNCWPNCGSQSVESNVDMSFFNENADNENPSLSFEDTAEYFAYSTPSSVSLYTSDNYPTETATEGITLDAEGSGEMSLNEDEVFPVIPKPKGRLVSLFTERNDTEVPCVTPKNETGHCRSFRQCLLHEVISNFNSYFQYLCLMPSRMVGICCPDNPVVEITNTEDNLNVVEEQLTPMQPADGCGFNSRTRIVGGKVSNPHEWTWMVALLKRNRFFCGGVLINDLYVLTAAHCTLGINVKDLSVRLGEYNFNNKTRHEQDLAVSEIKRHAQFMTLTFKHDIALLKLRRPVKYSRAVGTICLPKTGNEFVDSNATVVGWGTVSFGGAASPILRQVTIQVWNNTDCDKTYVMEDINESFMCAGSPEKKDACQGDSGGPLMKLNEQGRWEVIGLVSWGRRCGDPMYPGVYTRVTTYLDWIQKNMQ